jgi:hypothetical protein
LAGRLGDADAFFGRQQGYQNVAFHARHGFDLALVADFHEQAVHLGAADFLVRHFASAMKNHRAHFVAFTEEADDLVLANLIIVFRGGGPKLDFLQLRATAALALLVRLFIGLVQILAVVGDFANRRIGRGRDFHQVEPFILGQLNGFKRLHDAELAAFFINHPDLAGANPLVDADAVALPEAAFCDKSPLDALLIAVANRLTHTGRKAVEPTPTPHSAKTPGDGLQSIACTEDAPARGCLAH